MKDRFKMSEIDELSGDVQGLMCCGLSEYSGMDQINSIRDARVVRRAAHMESGAGFVFVTTTNERTEQKEKFLTGAKFKKMVTFENPNTGNKVTVWGAKTLKSRVVEDGDPFPRVDRF